MSRVIVRRQDDEATVLDLEGTGLGNESVVHIARYASGEWAYIAALALGAVSGDHVAVTAPGLPPGEYVALGRNSDQTLSPPARFLIAAEHGYRFPAASGERWIVTQGPYGSFSHWNRSLHAWDLAPPASRRVAAMRGGIVHAHDLGKGRPLNRRSFGNYITLDHGDGEYSHYAHLATGTFVVRNGQRIEPGQALAMAGNSGFSLGEGGGVHVQACRYKAPGIEQ